MVGRSRSSGRSSRSRSRSRSSLRSRRSTSRRSHGIGSRSRGSLFRNRRRGIGSTGFRSRHSTFGSNRRSRWSSMRRRRHGGALTGMQLRFTGHHRSRAVVYLTTYEADGTGVATPVQSGVPIEVHESVQYQEIQVSWVAPGAPIFSVDTTGDGVTDSPAVPVHMEGGDPILMLPVDTTGDGQVDALVDAARTMSISFCPEQSGASGSGKLIFTLIDAQPMGVASAPALPTDPIPEVAALAPIVGAFDQSGIYVEPADPAADEMYVPPLLPQHAEEPQTGIVLSVAPAGLPLVDRVLLEAEQHPYTTLAHIVAGYEEWAEQALAALNPDAVDVDVAVKTVYASTGQVFTPPWAIGDRPLMTVLPDGTILGMDSVQIVATATDDGEEGIHVIQCDCCPSCVQM